MRIVYVYKTNGSKKCNYIKHNFSQDVQFQFPVIQNKKLRRKYFYLGNNSVRSRSSLRGNDRLGGWPLFVDQTEGLTKVIL